MVIKPNIAVKLFTNNQSTQKPIEDRITPKYNAMSLEIIPAGIGLDFVLSINLSISLSYH